LQAADLEKVALTYERVLQVTGARGDADQLSRDIEGLLQELALAVHPGDHPFNQALAVLHCHFKLYGLCSSMLVQAIESTDPRLAELLRFLHGTWAGFMLDDVPAAASQMTQQLQAAERARAEAERKAAVLEDRLSDTLRAGQKLEIELEQIREELNAVRGDLEDERSRGDPRFHSARREDEGHSRSPSPGRSVPRASSYASIHGYAERRSTRSVGPPLHTERRAAMRSSSEVRESRGEDRPPMSSRTAVGAPLTARLGTLRGLREQIGEIYASKLKYDERCLASKIPRETMEQHMYTYLWRKHGLKHIVVENASSILQGVQKYSSVDNDVLVFGKILRHEVDEEFRFVQQQLKDTARELLRVLLRGRYPHKPETALQGMLDKRLNGTIDDLEAQEVVRYMYNDSDADAILDGLAPEFLPAERQWQGRGEELTHADGRRRVDYGRFLHFLLEFQLQGHERFLLPFLEEFRRLDEDRDGVIDRDGVQELIQGIRPELDQAGVRETADMIDPNGLSRATLSTCVAILCEN